MYLKDKFQQLKILLQQHSNSEIIVFHLQTLVEIDTISLCLIITLKHSRAKQGTFQHSQAGIICTLQSLQMQCRHDLMMLVRKQWGGDEFSRLGSNLQVVDPGSELQYYNKINTQFK